MRVLFVCFGNLCRSPMAEGIARKTLAEESPHLTEAIRFSSAGVGAIDGNRATGDAVEALRLRGIDISDHRARSLTDIMVVENDLVLVMEEGHREVVSSLARGHYVPTFLLCRLGEAAQVVLNKERHVGLNEPFSRLERLVDVAGVMERNDSWELPSYRYEVSDPIGMALDSYIQVADKMTEPIRNILSVIAGRSMD